MLRKLSNIFLVESEEETFLTLYFKTLGFQEKMYNH